MATHTNETWKKDKNGNMVLVNREIVEVAEVDLIAEKEAQLLAMYEELQALKNNK